EPLRELERPDAREILVARMHEVRRQRLDRALVYASLAQPIGRFVDARLHRRGNRDLGIDRIDLRFGAGGEHAIEPCVYAIELALVLDADLPLREHARERAARLELDRVAQL